jgi:hypothetical protein
MFGDIKWLDVWEYLPHLHHHATTWSKGSYRVLHPSPRRIMLTAISNSLAAFQTSFTLALKGESQEIFDFRRF